MSEVIDSRIVEMRFDNSQFESNVRESMKTIDNLKSSLNFEDSIKGLDKVKVDIDASGAVRGLQEISDAASECDLSQISDSVESVKLSFSALEIMAVTALGKITSAAIDAGAKMVNAFAIRPITDGFAEYNQQLKSTRVITSNTGQELSEVTKVLDDLNVYADKTIYSFGDMTQAMGYFTSALGEQSAEAAAVIAKGISNWAASTGQGNEVAKRVMYQVSQALSTGMFRLQDWKSIENTGAMAGARYQKAFIETAADMYGMTYEEFKEAFVDSEGSFRESLTKNEWLTNEVFLNTMMKFANMDGSGAFQWMEDAATKVLTFSDLLDTVREQLGTGWGETWKIVFGTFEDSLTFFTGISEKISGFIQMINDARNQIFQGWSDRGGHKLLFGISETDTGAIGKILDGILNLLSQVHLAFINAFGSEFLTDILYGATEAILKVANVFERLTSLPIVYSALGSIFSILKSVFSVIQDLYKIIEPFLSLALTAVEHILKGISSVAEVVANIVNIISEKFSGLASVLTAPFQAASNFISDTFGKALDFIAQKISSLWNWLKQFDIFGIMGGSEEAIGSDIVSGVTDVEKEISKVVSNADSQIDKSIDNATKGIKSVSERLADLGVKIDSENDLKGDGWQNIFWNAINKEKRQQHYAEELWDQIEDVDDSIKKVWLDVAAQNGYYDPGVYEELSDIWEQWAHVGKYANEEFSETTANLDAVTTELESTEKKSKEVTDTWWNLIKETDKQRYFVADYWDLLTEEQKEGWKQYALGLGLFTEEELRQLESTEKSVDALLDDRDRLALKKRKEADAWWDLIDEDKKKQFFAGEFWEDLTDEQREAWRQRAEEYKLYDPEEYARLLSEMAAAEEAAFSPETTEEIVESTGAIGSWFEKASKIPVIGGFLKDFGWLTTKVVKNTKSFASAVGTSFGGFFDFVKLLNGTDLTFFEKFNLATTYFKDHVVDYLGELVIKNFKTVGDVISNTDLVSKLTSFTASVKDRFTDFKHYVKDINANSELTFPQKFKSTLDYFNTNILGFFGKQIGDKFREIANNISNNKIVTNLVSLGTATKTKFEEFKLYIADLNANTEFTFPEKLSKSLEFLKTNVIDYFIELINKNLKSVGIDIEKIGKDISDALTAAANFILETLNKLGIDTEAIRKFFWNDDGTLKSIPELITELGNEIEQALNAAKEKLRSAYEQFFPSTEEGKLTGPLGWLVSAKEKIDGFVDSIFGSSKKLEKAQAESSGNGLFTAALGVLGLTGGSSIMKTVGNVNSLFSFGKNIGIAGKVDFGKIAIGVALAAGAFGLLSKIDFTKLGIDFSVFTDYFKDGEGNLLTIPDAIDKIGKSISNSTIGQWVGNTAQLIGRNFGTAFGLLKDNTVFFFEFLKALNGSDLSFPQKFSLALTFFKDHFVNPFGELAKKNLKTIGIDIDSFLAKFKSNEGEWLSIGDIITKVGDKISGEIEIQKKKFEQTSVGQWITKQIETFKAAHPQLMAWLDSVGKNVSDVFSWVGDTSKLIGRNVSTAFTLFGEQFGIFKDQVIALNDDTELTFPQKFKKALELFKKDFVDPFAELAKQNLKTVGIDIDAFVNYFKNNEGDWLSISDIITKIGTSIHDAFDNLKKKFEQSNFGQWLSKKFSNISEWFSNFTENISKFAAPVLGGVAFALILSRIGQMFDFIISIGQVISGRTPSARAEAFATKAQAFALIVRDVASAVIMIAISLAGLSLLNQDELARASDSINQVLKTSAVLAGALTVMSFFTSKKDAAKSGALALLEVAGSVMLIVAAFKLVTTITLDWGQLIQQFAILAVLMGMVVALAHFAPSINGSKDSLLGMIGVATAVLEMVGALYLVQVMLETHDGIGWALVTLLGLVGTFALICKAAENVKWQSGLGLILMAYSLRTMIDALEYLTESDFIGKFKDDLLNNILKVIAVFASLYLLAGANKLAGGGKAGLSMISIAVSVWALAKAMETIADIPVEKILPALGVVSVLTIIMGSIFVLYSKTGGEVSTSLRGMIVTTANLYSVVIAVLLLCAAVVALSAVDQSSLITAALVVGGLTTVVGLIAVLMAKFSKSSDFGRTLGLLTSATAVAVAMGALILALDHYIPDKSNLNEIATSVGLLTGVVGALGILYALVNEHLRVQMPSIGDSLKLFGSISIVVAAMGAVLTIMANAIPKDVSSESLWTMAGTVSVMTAVVSFIALLFGSASVSGAFRVSNVTDLFDELAAISLVAVGMGLLISQLANSIPTDVSESKLWTIALTVSTLTTVVSVIAGVLGSVHIDMGAAVEGAGAILILGLVIELLGAIALVITGWQGGNIDKLVSTVERIGRGMAKMVDSLMTSFGKLSWDKLLIVLGAAAASMLLVAAVGADIAIGMAAVIGAIGLIVEGLALLAVLLFKGDDGKNADVIMNQIVPTIERIGKGMTEMFESMMSSIGSLSWWQLTTVVGVMAAALVALGAAGPVIGLNLGVFAVEMAAAAALVVGLLDLTLPWFEKFANEGIPIFERITSGIVEIASIIINGIVSNVESIITCLRDFTDFASADFDVEKVGKAVGIASQLTEVVGAFVGDDFLGMLGKFVGERLFGEANRDAFKKNISCLTDILDEFKLNISFWTPVDLAKTKIAADIAQQLTDICNKFSDTDLLTAVLDFITNGEWSDRVSKGFNADISALGSALNTFCTEVNSIENFDETKATSAITIAEKMIALVKKFTPRDVLEAIDTLLKSIFADANSLVFKDSIGRLSSAVTTFCTEVSKWVVPSGYEAKFAIVDAMIDFVNKMPALDSGLMSIDDFGASVEEFSKSFLTATYYLNEALSKAQIEDYDGKMALMDDLIELTNKLPTVASSMEKFLGYNVKQSLGDFGTDIESFGTNLKKFAEAMNGVPTIKNWDSVSTVITELIDFSKLLPKGSSTMEGIVGYDFQMDFKSFGENISAFSESFETFITKINGISIDDGTLTKFGQMQALVGKLAELAKQLPQSFTQADASGATGSISTFTQSFTDFMHDIVGDKSGAFGSKGYTETLFDQVQRVYDELDDLGDFDDNGRREKLESLTGSDGILQQLSTFAQNLPSITTNSTTLSTFGLEIYELANHVSDAVASLNGDDTGGAYKFDPEPLKQMAEGVKGIVSSFTGISTEDLGHISSILDSIAKLKSNDGKTFGEIITENLVGSLFNIPKEQITGAQTNVGSVGELLSSLGGFGDSINKILPEGGLNTSGLSTLFGSFDTASNSFSGGGILASIPTSLDTFITTMPTENDLAAPKEALTSMFSGIDAEAFNFDGLSPLMGTFTQGQGFDDSGFIQMMPKEIQEYITNMTGEGSAGIEGANTVITDLVTGVSEAGSITPDLAENFNNTLDAFATNGISSYVNVFTSGETETKLNDAGRTIVEKTGKGIDAALKSLPNTIDTASKSVVKWISDILSGDNTNPYDVPGPKILDKTANGITAALSNASVSLKNAVESVVDLIVNILSGNESSDPYRAPGSSIVSKTADGINSALNDSSYYLESAARSIVSVITNILSGYNDYPNPYQSAGENVVSGFASGMSNTDDVYNAAYEVGRRAISGLSKAIDSKSPSKEAMKYGEYFSEGFGIGINSYGKAIETASGNIGNEALLGLTSYVGRVYDLLDSGMDFNPTITPILDLSEIQNGVGMVDAMFSRQQAYSANMEVKGAIRARTDAMKAVSTTDNSRNFGGFTFNIYTQGSDANAIARQIGNEVTRKLRSTGNLI